MEGRWGEQGLAAGVDAGGESEPASTVTLPLALGGQCKQPEAVQRIVSAAGFRVLHRPSSGAGSLWILLAAVPDILFPKIWVKTVFLLCYGSECSHTCRACSTRPES